MKIKTLSIVEFQTSYLRNVPSVIHTSFLITNIDFLIVTDIINWNREVLFLLVPYTSSIIKDYQDVNISYSGFICFFGL